MDIRFDNQLVDASWIVSMTNENTIESGRSRLGFVDMVRKKFAFLSLCGFSEIEALPTIVRYRRGNLELDVYYGRQSYEVGVQVGRADEKFSMSELIRLADPSGAEKYRNPAATNSAALLGVVEQLAELFRRYGERALRDDPGFLADLRRQRESWAKAYALDVLVEQTRPKAEAAFREGRYREAAELYEKIADRLSPTERAKLIAARKRK